MLWAGFDCGREFDKGVVTLLHTEGNTSSQLVGLLRMPTFGLMYSMATFGLVYSASMPTYDTCTFQVNASYDIYKRRLLLRLGAVATGIIN